MRNNELADISGIAMSRFYKLVGTNGELPGEEETIRYIATIRNVKVHRSTGRLARGRLVLVFGHLGQGRQPGYYLATGRLSSSRWGRCLLVY